MKQETIQGYTVVAPDYTKHGRRTHRVVGIGLWTPAAWADAAQQETQGKLDGATMQRLYPRYKTVNAKLTVTYDLTAELKL